MLPSKRKFFVKWKIEKEEIRKDAFRNYVSQVHAQKWMLQVERTFMAQEYGQRLERTLFPRAVRLS